MLQEIRDLGFQYAELSHGTRISLLPGILEAVDAGEIKISSLHNFCPLPMGVTYPAPNLYQFSAERARERELAERYTVKTIEFAARVKAPVVVLHSGSIEMKDYTDKLLDLVGRGQKETPKYSKLCTELDEKREAKKEPYVERVNELLKKLLVPPPKRKASGWGLRTARGWRNCRSKAISNSCSVSSPARTSSIGTTPATPKSRRTSGSSSTPCIWNPCATASSAFTSTTCSFPVGTTVRRAQGRLTSPPSSRWSSPSTSRCSSSAPV